MPRPHIIRLRGPWELTPAGASSEIPTAGSAAAFRVEVPGDWQAALGTGFRGRALYRRRFNKPTNLESHERVWLCCAGAHERAEAILNAHRLGRIEGDCHPAEFDITDLLASRNDLMIEVTCLGGPRPGALAEVRLEIRIMAG